MDQNEKKKKHLVAARCVGGRVSSQTTEKDDWIGSGVLEQSKLFLWFAAEEHRG